MKIRQILCSICGGGSAMDTSGPGPHYFHLACINGAINYMALTQEIGGDASIKRMAIWPNAEKAGIAHPFPPFGNPGHNQVTQAAAAKASAPANPVETSE